jgi:hypothetical protein
MADMGHFVRDDQVMLGIDRGLHVIADDAGAPSAGGHGTGIGIGQRDLLVRRLLHPSSDLVEALHLRLDPGDLVLEPGYLALRDRRRLPVRPVQLR